MSEQFTHDQITSAIRSFLEYGETSLCPQANESHDTVACKRGHHGYFSGDGFAARALRAHLEIYVEEHSR